MTPTSGELRVRAERVGRRTVLADLHRTAPFHLGRTSERAGDGGAEVIIQGVGPGYLPGDAVTTDIRVGPGATLTVRGQGATRLHGAPAGQPTTARVRLDVASGGALVYLPGELIPFRDAALDQRTEIRVAPGGRAAVGEIVTPGRVAMGEADVYRSLRLDVEAWRDGRRILVERARLDPTALPLSYPARHGPYPVAGTLWLVGDGWSDPVPGDVPGVIAAAGASPGVTLVRLLGPTVQAVATALVATLASAASAGQ